jgi:flagellar biosynthetic protein FliO
MWQQFLAVFLVLGLLFAALWLLRHQGLARFVPGLARPDGKQRRQMQVLERVALDTGHSLHLVALNGLLIVVGVSPGGCRRIATLPADAATLPQRVDKACRQSAKTASI